MFWKKYKKKQLGINTSKGLRNYKSYINLDTQSICIDIRELSIFSNTRKSKEGVWCLGEQHYPVLLDGKPIITNKLTPFTLQVVNGNELLFSNTSKSTEYFLNTFEDHALCIGKGLFANELTIVTNPPKYNIACYVTRAIDSTAHSIMHNGNDSSSYYTITENTVFFGNTVYISGLDGEYEHLYNFFTSFNKLNPNTKMEFVTDITINLTQYHSYPPVYMQKLIEAIKSVVKPASDDDIQVTQEGIWIKKTKA